jgi:hypothetical protein
MSRALRSVCVALALSLLAVLLPLTGPASANDSCGPYRWPVQTLSDPARRHVASGPTTTSIQQLRSRTTPMGLDDASPRQPPTETTLWRVHARMLQARLRPNGDVRAVIAPRDDVRAKMVVVFHARRCIGSAYRRTKQAQARGAVLEACGSIGSTWTDLGGLVSVTGVGFWDPRSVSAAPNGIQLNPVLGFRGSCWHRSVFTALLVGDSVPHNLAHALADATGWRVIDVTHGGCPVTGEEPVDASGVSWTTPGDCRDSVVRTQRDAMATHPDLVLWWDRPSTSHFLTPHGRLILAGTTRFWRWRHDALDRAVHRLSAAGATVALVATEPVGLAIDQTYAWHAFMVDHYGDLTTRWNRMMARYASSHGVIAASVSITDVVCHAEVSPCDDTIDGVPARPKGQHYEGPGIPVALDTLLRRLRPVTDRLGG